MDLKEDFKEHLGLVKELALGCPMKDALPGCPLSAVREMSMAARLVTVERMGVEELQRIVQHHTICMETRS